MQQFISKGHHLFTDNYYTSINLWQYLYEHQTRATGFQLFKNLLIYFIL